MIPNNTLNILVCDKQGHGGQPIQIVCIKKGCKSSIPCCMQCMMEDHKNHKTEDFKALSKIKEQENYNLVFLRQLLKFTEAICELSQQWKKSIDNLIHLFKEKQQPIENMNLQQLSDHIIKSFHNNGTKQHQQTVYIYKEQLREIGIYIENLKSLSNSFLYNSQILTAKNVEINQFSLKQLLDGHQTTIQYVALTNDDKYLATTGSNNELFLWNFQNKTIIQRFQIDAANFYGLQFSEDNTLLVVQIDQEREEEKVYSDDSIYGNYVDTVMKTYHSIQIFDITCFHYQPVIYINLENSIQDMIATDDSRYLLFLDLNFLKFYDLQQQKLYSTDLKNKLLGITFSKQQQIIACCGTFTYLYKFKKSPSTNLISEWKSHSKQTQCVQFIQNSQVIMTSGDESIRFWNFQDIIKQEFKYFKEIQSVSSTFTTYPFDNTQVIISQHSASKFIEIWDYQSTKLIQTIRLPHGLVKFSFAITSDFKAIITGAGNQRIYIFEQQVQNDQDQERQSQSTFQQSIQSFEERSYLSMQQSLQFEPQKKKRYRKPKNQNYNRDKRNGYQ